MPSTVSPSGGGIVVPLRRRALDAGDTGPMPGSVSAPGIGSGSASGGSA